MSNRWRILLMTVICAGFLAYLLLTPLRPRYTQSDVRALSPGMTLGEIKAVLGHPTVTDDLDREMPAHGEVRRDFWQLHDNVWVLIGFGEKGRACWVLKHNPEGLPERPVDWLRRLFTW